MSTETAPAISVKHVQQPLVGQSPEMQKLDIFSLVNENPTGLTEEKKIEPVVEEVKDEPIEEVVETETTTETIPEVEETVERVVDTPVETEVTETTVTEPEKAEELPVGRKAANAAFAAKDREVRDLKKKLAELEPLAKEAPELRKKLEETPKADPEIVTKLSALEKELEKTAKERDTYKQRVSVSDITQSDEYQSLVTKPYREEILPTLIDIQKASNGEVTVEMVNAVIAESDPVRRRELTRAFKEKLDPADYNELSAIIPKYRGVAEAKTRLERNASEVLALKQHEKENMSKQQLEAYKKEIGDAYKQHDARITKEAFGDFDINSDPELKQSLEQSGQQAENFDWYNAPVQAQAAIKAALKNFPIALALTKKQLNDKIAELEKVNKELADLKTATKKIVKATPQAGSTTTGAQRVDSSPKEVTEKLDGTGLRNFVAGTA